MAPPARAATTVRHQHVFNQFRIQVVYRFGQVGDIGRGLQVQECVHVAKLEIGVNNQHARIVAHECRRDIGYEWSPGACLRAVKRDDMPAPVRSPDLVLPCSRRRLNDCCGTP